MAGDNPRTETSLGMTRQEREPSGPGSPEASRRWLMRNVLGRGTHRQKNGVTGWGIPPGHRERLQEANWGVPSEDQLVEVPVALFGGRPIDDGFVVEKSVVVRRGDLPKLTEESAEKRVSVAQSAANELGKLRQGRRGPTSQPAGYRAAGYDPGEGSSDPARVERLATKFETLGQTPDGTKYWRVRPGVEKTMEENGFKPVRVGDLYGYRQPVDPARKVYVRESDFKQLELPLYPG